MDRPTRFGEYTLLKRVASGGMAEIWRAQIRGPAGFRRDVAIKTIHAQHSDETEFIRMLLDEARIAARLIHPHIAQVLNCGSIDGIHYIAMEFVNGHSLGRILQRLAQRNERLSLPECLFISIGLLRALGYAHRQVDDDGKPMGIVHRDVSPHNVMVSYGGAVKLVDFGVARAANKLHKTETGVVQGKVAYMAPEHLDGQVVDHRSDQYAAALVALELIANRRAYTAETSSELVKKVLMGQVRDVDEMVDGVPAKGRLVPVLRRALSIDRDGRFPSCDVMAAELAQVLNEIEPAFHEESLGNRVRELFATDYQQDQKDIRAIEAELANIDTGNLEPASFGSSATMPILTLSPADEVRVGGRGRWIALVAVLAMLAGGGIAAALKLRGPEVGSLRIVTAPPGATVTIDGALQPGTTPTTIPEVEVGADMAIVATLAQHKPARRDYRMGRGDQELNLDLVSVLASLRIVGAAPEVEVRVAGEVVGQTDATGALEVELPEGDDVAISVDRVGGSPYTTTFSLNGGQIYSLDVPPLDRVVLIKRKRKGKVDKPPPPPPAAKGTINVACLPWCEIRIDGRKVKNSPLRDLVIAAGTHTVEVTNPPSGKTDKKKVVIEAGGRETLRFRLD